ncbi:MAG: 2-C-methyl-D-erythritol 2,4-cyclodiphosphate synthase [Bacteroidales bacterium]|jgi:2-C-methyl-D-erythritol 2,4-cyclodiphosphate synthase|nr:2-C-methyl-D-erythritol 2,4-cyclodiphosphate synthase [Bacteroidales bacterium]
MKIKVGIGYDVHKLEQGRKFFLGGIEIENSPIGAVGHSDADTLIHAIIDSILGAANMRDIGFQYPDNDDKYKGIDSKLLLKDTIEKVCNKGFKINNIDSIVCLQSPKISYLVPKMQETLANILNIDKEDITIKATTTEHLGFTGRKEGVACYSVCLLEKN